ncbi:LysR family transcriptional regulator [Pyxidicoccus sp. 3LG]
MDQLGAMTVFRRVVETGSYSSAARALRISVASASKQVAALEERLGARLLHRTTRRLALTEAAASTTRAAAASSMRWPTPTPASPSARPPCAATCASPRPSPSGCCT